MKLISKYFRHFLFFYSYLGNRIILLIGLSLVGGFLDGFGLALFIPLIQVAGKDQIDKAEAAESLGSLSFLLDFITWTGLELTAVVILVFLLSIFVAKGLFKYMESHYKVMVQMFFVKKIRYQMVDSLGDMEYRNFLGLDAGRVQNTLSGEIYKIVSAYVSYFNTLQSFVLLLVYVVLALLANFQFALVVSVGGYLSNLIFKVIFKYTESASLNNSQLSHKYQSSLIQAVHNFKYLKATNYFQRYKIKLKDYVDKIEYEQKKIGIFNAILLAAREPLVIAIVVGAILVEIKLLNGNIAAIFLSLMFFYRALNFIMLVQTHWQAFTANLGGLHVGLELLKDLETGKEQDISKKQVENIKSLSLQKVGFYYHPEKMVLHQIDLTIENNRSYALVGKSGSGKTTLTNLLVGLVHPTAGKFLLNGEPLRSFNLASYRSKIGYITQEAVIFNDTVFNNVTFWSDKTEENYKKFEHALNLANLSELVDSLPLKEETILGDSGALISGGQKQRISIARELFKEAQLLIFDEATSALDSETEKMIQQNIDSLKGSCNIVLIAHRLSTVKNADEILLMKDGEVECRGTFSQLLNESETFKSMVELQEF
ncbi:ABC transporter ATP-binding protein [Algoriphagus lutimaris]|uniref:ABC transporter ATP-binding protein n=1 Tax=Algoriphagus lutimaris TaxID=613197 RepID=UPI00196B49BC|nr:ABC transporter ATP-binding protein [Algoriphagus lutimaris]MBN3518687.1 ABC transporter ATP-binding protein [Algoriphagus lutimaris]